MGRFLKGAGIGAVFIAFSAGSAFAAGPTALNCAPGVPGSATVSIASGGTDTIEISNATGSTISFAATLTNPAGTGSLSYSMAGDIMKFPGTTSATITTAMPSPTYLMLTSPDSAVTLTMVCNPAPTPPSPAPTSPSTSLLETPVPDASAAANLTRTAMRKQLHDMLLGDDIRVGSTPDWGIDEADLARRAEIIDEVYFKRYQDAIVGYNRTLALVEESYADDPNRDMMISIAMGIYPPISEVLDGIYQEYLAAHSLSDEIGYIPVQGVANDASRAIDATFASNDVVRNTFSMLGYGPTGVFEGQTVLAEGKGWSVAATAVGAISQTSLSTGDIRSISGRGAINIVTSLTNDLTLGVALGMGAGNDDGVLIDNRTYNYSADVQLLHSLNRDLSLVGGVSYELTSNNYTVGAATGSGYGHLFTGNIGLLGSVNLYPFKLTPRLDLELSREHVNASTLSDGTTVAGFDSTSGQVSAGVEISRVIPILTKDSVVVFTPSLGVDGSLTLAQRTLSTGSTSESLGYGLGISAGLAFAVDDGLGLSLSTRVSRFAQTVGASVTGKVSAQF